MFLIDFTFLANFLQQIPQNLNSELTNLFSDINWELKGVQKCQYNNGAFSLALSIFRSRKKQSWSQQEALLYEKFSESQPLVDDT